MPWESEQKKTNYSLCTTKVLQISLIKESFVDFVRWKNSGKKFIKTSNHKIITQLWSDAEQQRHQGYTFERSSNDLDLNH